MTRGTQPRPLRRARRTFVVEVSHSYTAGEAFNRTEVKLECGHSLRFMRIEAKYRVNMPVTCRRKHARRLSRWRVVARASRGGAR